MPWDAAFILLCTVGIIAFLVQRYFPEKISIAFVSIIMIFTANLMSDLSIEWLVFSGGVIVGYITDFLGVFVNNWFYHTKSKYNYWIGFAWGVVVLALYHLRFAPFWTAIVVVLMALIILHKTKNRWPKGILDWVFMLLKICGVFIYPVMFMWALSLGIVIEYLAVSVFKVWTYPKINYLLIGLGYALIQIFVVYTAEIFLGSPLDPKINLYLLISILLYLIQYSLQHLRKHNKLPAQLDHITKQ